MPLVPKRNKNTLRRIECFLQVPRYEADLNNDSFFMFFFGIPGWYRHNVIIALPLPLPLLTTASVLLQLYTLYTDYYMCTGPQDDSWNNVCTCVRVYVCS
jgi:hypothetical protein